MVGGWRQRLVGWESEHPSGEGVEAAPGDEWIGLVGQRWYLCVALGV